MPDFETLGAFYLGRCYDAAARQATDDLFLYESRDLVTHALLVGMTGSGKTGLGIALLEEAAIDGVPAIVIDPKGDLTNLLLTFPELRAGDFEPWISGDDAARAGKTVSQFAEDQAERWRLGLAQWGQDGARVARLKAAAEFVVYTPGSTVATPVSALASLARPGTSDLETLRDRAQVVVSSLLMLAGIDADPLRSPEHILLSSILLSAWQSGESPDLAAMIGFVQSPPIARVGVLEVDSFLPPQGRFALAMALNALLASPGFTVWSTGVPLDVDSFLRSPAGKPRVSIFTLAHLDDRQRMFFVSLLLNAVAGWMRTQAGTSSLRAILYMDEIVGFFPPVANPPSKAPLLTLLKQGRAAGLGVVLATQNPVDLDYKGLANIGTWWMGRLQTERDKARLLDGLESASAIGGFDRGEIERELSGLANRVFLMRSAHEDALTLFQTRWTLSYLRGPLSRADIARFRAAVPDVQATPALPSVGPPHQAVAVPGAMMVPVMPPGIVQYFSPDAPIAGPRLLRPFVYGAVQVRFVEPRLKLDEMKRVTLAAPIAEGPIPVDWAQAVRIDLAPELLEPRPSDGDSFAAVPPAALKARHYDAWSKQLAGMIASTESIELWKSASTGEVSRPEETEREFRTRLQQASREARDRALDALRRKYGPRQAALDEKLRRAQQAIQREAEQADGQRLQTVISVGATIVGALFGRKAVNAGTIGRATTAARGVGRSMKESSDVRRAGETVAALEAQRQQLEEDVRAELATLESASDVLAEVFERIVVKPKRTNVSVRLVALMWAALPLTPRP